jgi:hypothetical protein
MNQEIVRRLSLYLFDEEALEAFEDWFLPSQWANEGNLAAEVRLHLMEHDCGDLDEFELKEALFRLVEGEQILKVDSANELVPVEVTAEAVAA